MSKSRAEAVETLADLIEDYKICMLVTRDESEDMLRARPMAMQNERFGGTLWFFTDNRAHKTDEVEDERDVCLTFSDTDDETYISVSGKAFVSRDRAKMKELWQEGLRAWFPDGPEGEHVALLRVEATGAEYWDAPNGKLVQLFGLAKALATGERYQGEGSDNEKIDL
jgi:general stress protein 26